MNETRTPAPRKQTFIEQRREEEQSLIAKQVAVEASLSELHRSVEELRLAREEAQQQAAQVSAELAGLEERRRGAQSAFERVDRMFVDLMQRVDHNEHQLAAASAEQRQRLQENEQLSVSLQQFIESRDQALSEAARLSAEATELRSAVAEIDRQVRRFALKPMDFAKPKANELLVRPGSRLTSHISRRRA